MKPLEIKDGEYLLDLWLKGIERTLQNQQRQYIIDRFSNNGSPLYLRFAFEEARLWHSYDLDVELGASTNEIILQNLFARLSATDNHGSNLVSRVIGYITATKYGISETELLTVLVCDNDFYEKFLEESFSAPKSRRIPSVVWIRLYHDLEPYLSISQIDNVSLLRFAHQQLAVTAKAVFLQDEQRTNLHENLASYFADLELYTYIDDAQHLNRRKLSELVYHQLHGKLNDDVYRTLTDSHFLEARIRGTIPRRGGINFQEIRYSTLLLKQDIQSVIEYWTDNTELNSNRQLLTLQELAGALDSEQQALERYPELVFQQLTNRISTKEQPILQNPPAFWLHIYSDKDWVAKHPQGKTWPGYFPLAFMPSRHLIWMIASDRSISSKSRVMQVDTETGDMIELWQESNAKYCLMNYYDYDHGIEILRHDGYWCLRRPNTEEVVHEARYRFDNSAEIVAARKCQDVDGILVTISYSNHQPAELYLLEPHYSPRRRLVVKLGWGYLREAPMSVLTNMPGAICLYDDGRSLALVNYQENRVIVVYPHDTWVKSSVVIEHADLLVSGTSNGTIRDWRLSTGELLSTYGGEFNYVSDIVFVLKYDALIAVGPTYKGPTVIHIWDLSKGGYPNIIYLADQNVRQLKVSPDEEMLYAGGDFSISHKDANIRYWRIQDLFPKNMGEYKPSQSYHHLDNVTQIFISKEKNRAFTLSMLDYHEWDIETGKSMKYESRGISHAAAKAMEHNLIKKDDWEQRVPRGEPESAQPKDRIILPQGFLIHIEPETGNMLSYEEFPEPCTESSFSPSGKRIFIAINDRIEVWDIEPLHFRGCIIIPDKVEKLKAIDDSRFIAADSNGSVQFINVQDHEVRVDGER